MKIYTNIDFFTIDGNEAYGTIMRGKKIVGNCMMIGEWKDEEDILLSLDDEASRLGYIKNKIT